MTQVAIISTSGPTLRSEIDGYGFEDSDLLIRRSTPDRPDRIFIGFTPSPMRDIPHYGTVLEMLADGWVMLGPPVDETWTNEDGKRIEQWGWWLTRVVAR